MTTRAMREATFLILTALADGSQHGYGIIAEVQQISGGRVWLRAGTLYTALDRLRADELIGVDREELVDNRLRRYYRLTPGGGQRLAAEARWLLANAAAPLHCARGEVPVTAGPGDGMAAGHGRLRASHADREHVIDMLKAAFVQGRLSKYELDVRVGQALASRSYAELAALTADIPAGLIGPPWSGYL